MKSIRQGDVLLVSAASLPNDVQAVALDRGRIILAYGEVTGHAHAITPQQIVSGAIKRAQQSARLWTSPDGGRWLVVLEPVELVHEEHTAHEIPAGIWRLPQQVEYTPAALRRVED